MAGGNDAWRNAIGMTESGNNYSAVGPLVKNGRYAGERALGRYQVMPGNLPQWTKQALGRTVGADEFLRSSEIQDAVFDYQFGNSVAKHGSFQDAASVWHSGRPLSVAAAAGATDGYMDTVSYVKKASGFLANGNFTQPGAYSIAGQQGPMSGPEMAAAPGSQNAMFGTKAGPAWNTNLELLTQESEQSVGQLGRGGFGDVFGAVQRTINQTTAGGSQVIQSQQTAQPVQALPPIQIMY